MLKITELEVRNAVDQLNTILSRSTHEVRLVRKEGVYAIESKRKNASAIHGVGDVVQGSKRDCYNTVWAMIKAIALFQN